MFLTSLTREIFLYSFFTISCLKNDYFSIDIFFSLITSLLRVFMHTFNVDLMLVSKHYRQSIPIITHW